MTPPSGPVGRPEPAKAIDISWLEAVIDGRPASEVLAARDVGAIFRYLRGQGWSLTALCAATGLSETRIRSVMRRAQRITSYQVLERVALGLGIPRGAMGLAYTVDAGYGCGPPDEAASGSPPTA